jgi:hypothetical protein
MEFLRHFQRKQLARKGCPNDFLDGQTLVSPYSIWILNRRRGWRRPLVVMVYVGYGDWENLPRKDEAIELLAETQ